MDSIDRHSSAWTRPFSEGRESQIYSEIASNLMQLPYRIHVCTLRCGEMREKYSSRGMLRSLDVIRRTKKTY